MVHRVSIESTEAYRWDIGNKITIVYVDRVLVDEDEDEDGVEYSLCASPDLECKNRGMFGVFSNCSFNYYEAVRQLRAKISKEIEDTRRKLLRLETQLNKLTTIT